MLGENAAEPIVLDSSDGEPDVDVDTVDDFVEGTEVEVCNDGETWSPGRVRQAFGAALTIEVPVRLQLQKNVKNVSVKKRPS